MGREWKKGERGCREGGIQGESGDGESGDGGEWIQWESGYRGRVGTGGDKGRVEMRACGDR